MFRRNWFVLAQTDGQPYAPPAIPGWDATRALTALDITETSFEMMNGNVQGYARGRTIAVSRVATNPLKTRLHEAAHVLLGHTAVEQTDSDSTPRTLAEIEAESVAMLVCAALNQPGIEYSRGYVQHWLGRGHTIPETSARRIFKTADQTLRAGREDSAKDETCMG